MALGKLEKKVFLYLIESMKACTGRFGFTDLQKNADFGIDPPNISMKQYLNYLDKLKEKGFIQLLPESHFAVTDEGLEYVSLDPADYPEYQAEYEDPDADPDPEEAEADPEEEETEADPEENPPPGIQEVNPDPDPEPEPVPVPVPEEKNTVFDFVDKIKTKKLRETFLEFIANFATQQDIKLAQDPEFLNAYADHLDPDGHYLPFGIIDVIKWKFGKKTLQHDFENKVPIFLNVNTSRLEIPIRMNERGLNI